MHLILGLLALGIALEWRRQWPGAMGHWTDRWHRALLQFALPPLLLLSTAIALVGMGPQGQMVWCWEGWMAYGLALGWLLTLLGVALWRLGQLGRSHQRLQTFPQQTCAQEIAHVLPHPLPFIAQVGFWRPRLVVSQGLLKALDVPHLQAAIAHEQAHARHRDTFWFFWLGCLRDVTAWLPQTDALWHELLLLRELRADHDAAQAVDPLVLAEALFQVVSAPYALPDHAVAFGETATQRDRLTERIDALLTPDDAPPRQPPAVNWLWWLPVLLPLGIIPFHF